MSWNKMRIVLSTGACIVWLSTLGCADHRAGTSHKDQAHASALTGNAEQTSAREEQPGSDRSHSVGYGKKRSNYDHHHDE